MSVHKAGRSRVMVTRRGDVELERTRGSVRVPAESLLRNFGPPWSDRIQAHFVLDLI